MKNIRKAAEMALEALNMQTPLDQREFELRNAAIEALRQALAQPEQEPFGYFRYDLEWDGWVETEPNNGEPLYTAPPKREWVGLTDEDKDELLNLDNWTDIVEAVEAKLKEKNT